MEMRDTTTQGLMFTRPLPQASAPPAKGAFWTDEYGWLVRTGDLRTWYCEMHDKSIRWVEPFWPLFCPICGRAVHEQLSSHHQFREDSE